ncbi:MAG: protein-L-isoaspartate(D-aspartate) O-methyltransferase [Deltaproteobacteria bacterium]|nr:protein-L-isoaspartate(D-aspartate) O-methyltransferase [Deltaproteobacteria bacterium]
MIDHRRASRRMINEYVISRGVNDKRVLEAMIEVPRHLFVEEAFQGIAYGDKALPIGDGQSISRPYTVAKMTEALGLEGGERVLEIGGGSAYQSAILSRLAGEVFTIERLGSLAVRARRLLHTLKCMNVLFKVGDGTLGWKDKAPFDAILVAASFSNVPEELLYQLKEGGRVVMPVGKAEKQRLKRFIRKGEGFREEDLGECIFVPLIGEKGWSEREVND